MKIIQVYEDTHKAAKEMAMKRGMTLKGYIKKLVEDDQKRLKKGD